MVEPPVAVPAGALVVDAVAMRRLRAAYAIRREIFLAAAERGAGDLDAWLSVAMAPLMGADGGAPLPALQWARFAEAEKVLTAPVRRALAVLARLDEGVAP